MPFKTMYPLPVIILAFLAQPLVAAQRRLAAARKRASHNCHLLVVSTIESDAEPSVNFDFELRVESLVLRGIGR